LPERLRLDYYRLAVNCVVQRLSSTYVSTSNIKASSLDADLLPMAILDLVSQSSRCMPTLTVSFSRASLRNMSLGTAKATLYHHQSPLFCLIMLRKEHGLRVKASFFV